jgi:hypothetical protein
MTLVVMMQADISPPACSNSGICLDKYSPKGTARVQLHGLGDKESLQLRSSNSSPAYNRAHPALLLMLHKRSSIATGLDHAPNNLRAFIAALQKIIYVFHSY